MISYFCFSRIDLRFFYSAIMEKRQEFSIDVKLVSGPLCSVEEIAKKIYSRHKANSELETRNLWVVCRRFRYTVYTANRRATNVGDTRNQTLLSDSDALPLFFCRLKR